MAKEKTSPYKSFGAIPRERFTTAPAAEGNKAASFKEDMYNMSALPEDDDASEYGIVKEAPSVGEESSEISSLRKRIEYYKNDSLEDPRIKEMQIRQLEIRLQEALSQTQEDIVLPSKNPAQDQETKKTGWWDKNFHNKPEETEGASSSPLANNKDPQQMKDQMARLSKVTGRLRKEAGFSDAQALEESPDYKELKGEISRIRYRLNKILEDKGKEKYKDEITQLRHELATHLTAFKKLSRERAEENSEPEPEPGSIIEPEPVPAELKKYEERRLMREQWRIAKDAYMNAYEQHLSDTKKKNAEKNILSKIAFWNKEEKSQALIASEQAYQEARQKYAGLLNGALENRAGTERGGDLEGYQAGLANRFVLQAAHEKLAKEKEYLPDAKSLRVFEKLQEKLKEHKRLIKVSGYVAVVGIGLVSAGVGAAIVAFGNKAVGAKLAAIGAAGGATLGASLGNSLSDTVIDYTGSRRDSAAKRAQRKWSLETMDKREKEYIERYRSHEAALRDKNFYIGVGTLAGGTLGAIAAGGGLDTVADMELAEASHVPPPLPPGSPLLFSPAPELETLSPGVVIEEQLDEALTAEPEPVVPEDTKSLDNFPKEEVLKNAPTVPDVSPDDVTFFDPPVPDSAPMLFDPAPHLEPRLEIPEAEEPAEVVETEPVELLHTFEPGRIDTVSEALFEAWKQDNDTLDEPVTKKEFLAQMYGAIAEIEKNPELNAELMEQMSIESGDIDKVQLGDTINLQPFFEYMNHRN